MTTNSRHKPIASRRLQEYVGELPLSSGSENTNEFEAMNPARHLSTHHEPNNNCSTRHLKEIFHTKLDSSSPSSSDSDSLCSISKFIAGRTALVTFAPANWNSFSRTPTAVLTASEDEALEEGPRQTVGVLMPSNATKTVKFQGDMPQPLPKLVCETVPEMSSFEESASQLQAQLVLGPAKAVTVTGYLAALTLEYSDKPGQTTAKTMGLEHLRSARLAQCLESTPVALLTCGYEHCALLTQQGRVMTWGTGITLGLGHVQDRHFPTVIPQLTGIHYVEAGAYHTAALSTHGRMYTWGRGEGHQLGLAPHQLEHTDTGPAALRPQPLHHFARQTVVGVACGEAHTLVLNAEGRVYAFGWGEDGQLGLPSSSLQHNAMGTSIQEITALRAVKVEKVRAGALFSACLSASGQVYVWGNGQHGQLGLGLDVQFEDFPRPLDCRAVDLICGESHVLCLTESGSVVGWGLGVAGEFADSANFPRGSSVACFHSQRVCQVLEEFYVNKASCY